MSQQLPTKEWRSDTWHRKAARPVTVWMAIFLVAGVTHLWIPEYRWVLIHIFTLGVLTNSIVLWSQHFTEKFLRQRLPDSARPWQLRRTYLLNAGIVVTILGEVLVYWWERHWILTQIGAAAVAVALGWHAVVLAQQWLRSEKSKRFRTAVFAYVLSGFALPVGAVFGALLSMGLPDELHLQLLMGHTVINLGGFLGLAAAGSLTVLFPSIWRINGLKDRSVPMIWLLSIGVVAATVGGILDSGLLAGGGLMVYAAGWIVGFQAWLTNVLDVAKDPRDRITYPSASILLAVLWLIGAVVFYAVQLIAAGSEIYLVDLPTMPLLIGFAAQLLIGVMSYLLPTTMGGGPAPKRAGLAELNRGGLFRLTLINLGFIFWQLADNSWLKVVLSVLVFGSFAAFAPLLLCSVKSQKAVLLKEKDFPRPEQPTTPWGQVTAGIAVLALILALFGGLKETGGTAAVSPTGTEEVTAVDVRAVGMAFDPAVVEVPAGNQVIITLTNDDAQAHDLKMASGVQSGRLAEGESMEMDLGVVSADMHGWCTIAGHEIQGMTFDVVVV